MQAIYFELGRAGEAIDPRLESILLDLCARNENLSCREFRLAVSSRGCPGILLHMLNPRLSIIGEEIRRTLLSSSIVFVEHYYAEAPVTVALPEQVRPGPDSVPTGSWAKAVSMLKFPWRVAPSWPASSSHSCYLERNRTIKQIKTYAQYCSEGKKFLRLRLFDKALQSFKRAHMLRPEKVGPLCWIARTQVASGHYSRAWKILRASWPRHEQSEPLNYWCGRVCFLLQHYERAVFYLSSSLAQRPDRHAANSLMGWSYLRMGNLKHAYFAFSRMLAMDNRQARGWYGLGYVFLHQGNYSLAHVKFKHAVSLAPESIRSWLALAICDGYLENWEELERDGAQLYELVGGYRRCLVAWALGCLSVRRGMYKRALVYFDFANRQIADKLETDCLVGSSCRQWARLLDSSLWNGLCASSGCFMPQNPKQLLLGVALLGAKSSLLSGAALLPTDQRSLQAQGPSFSLMPWPKAVRQVVIGVRCFSCN